MLLASTATPPAAAQEVSGRVVEAETRDPVPAALVALEGTSHGTFTDDEGRFHFEEVTPGPYRLTVNHSAYHPLFWSINIPSEGALEITLRLQVRVIPLDSLHVRGTPAPQRRRQSGHPHHVLVTRDDLESYELRGALHVGDVLALHAPNAVRVEESVMRSMRGPTVCIRSTRAIGSRTPLKPWPGCAPVFFDGVRMGDGDILLTSISLHDIEAVEFLPPMDAMTRLGHAGEAGAVFVTTRVGAERASESAILGEASQVAGYSGGRSHEAYLAAGATLGAVAGLGVTSVQYLLQDDGGICTSGCEWEILRVVGSGLLGMGVGELLHRLRGG